MIKPDSHLQVVSAFTVSFISAVGGNVYMPFLDDGNDLLSSASHWGLTFTLYICQLLKSNFNLSSTAALALLCFGAAMPLLAILWILLSLGFHAKTRLLGHARPTSGRGDGGGDQSLRNASESEPARRRIFSS